MMPLFSKRRMVTHMIQLLIPFSRMASAEVAATSPTDTVPWVQNQMAGPTRIRINTPLIAFMPKASIVISRRNR